MTIYFTTKLVILRIRMCGFYLIFCKTEDIFNMLKILCSPLVTVIQIVVAIVFILNFLFHLRKMFKKYYFSINLPKLFR